jgi:hypothetical protein
VKATWAPWESSECWNIAEGVCGRIVGTEADLARRPDLAEDKVYKSEYLGSGTFRISKPKRKARKTRQSRLKGTTRGARK